MRVTDKTELLESLENAHKLAWIRVNIVRKNVFIDRPPRGGVYRNEFRRFHSNRQMAAKPPSVGPTHEIGIVVKYAACPEAGRFRAGIEVVRLIKDGEIMIAHQCGATSLPNQVQTLHRIGAVNDDVPEAD